MMIRGSEVISHINLTCIHYTSSIPVKGDRERETQGSRTLLCSVVLLNGTEFYIATVAIRTDLINTQRK